ncbi:MAG: 3-hydroxybutyryl-CoA dehydrogenase [candidate division Zixibacteria bacterium HGW-Zixibacteria-1]|nr:MAG: 3-hydroxybutyryl-CoA dehydrogenase [candidate division Zixibacteria bacterium HGW-Zixibacteria-1]
MENPMFKKIGIIGCGQMGSGIAQVAAQAGYPVLSHEMSEELFEKGLRNITKLLDRAIEKGKLDSPTRDKILGNISGTTELSDMADCDIIIEAVTEDMTTKQEIFRELDAACKPETIFASNTSSLPIGDLAAVTKRRDKFIGLHFFNPVPIMKLVELVRTIDSSDSSLSAAKEFAESVGKTVVMAKDTPGFIVNVLLVPYLLDAIRQLENGLATRDDIDNGMKFGCGHPMGPLTLTDFIGLDTILYIADIMFDEFKNGHYAAPPLLRRMVNAGYLGKKSGRGFYDYNQ